ncbi:hypothetical protein WR25_17345 [Diploscapter pachys]|uniref:J domain-containing protein n=1 Tax=Diploscapter pachys TaxID=2018661 RepID=A0A2A2JMT0_9BILA|nr:hypothetical protein WR25_17345 [Diploscapter pachys]
MFLDECKEHFDTECLYELLNIEQSATQAQVKKAYYKVSMKWHPDRADDAEAKTAHTVKFQIVSRAYTILSDKAKRKAYDETGSVDEENALLDEDAINLWRKMFKKVTEEDIKNFYDNYRGSEEEKTDIIHYYNLFKGDMNKILIHVILEAGQEERVIQLIRQLIEEGQLKSTAKFKATTSKASVAGRKRRADKEAKEAEEMLEEMKQKEGESSLEQMILARQADREKVFDAIADKYTKLSQKETKSKKSKKGK